MRAGPIEEGLDLLLLADEFDKSLHSWHEW